MTVKKEEVPESHWVGRLWRRVVWPERPDFALKSRVYGRLAAPLLGALGRKLATFEESLVNFAWPVKEFPWNDARIVQPNRLLSLSAPSTITEPASEGRLYRLFSRGFEPYQITNLSPDIYSMTLTLGNLSETVSISIDEGMTWNQALKAVQDAVNASSLPVEAEVVRQYRPFSKVASVPGVGKVLLLSVQNQYWEQPLSVVDSHQGLLRSLDFSVPTVPVGPATARRYDLVSPGPAITTRYLSTVVDPGALAGLAAGDFDFSLAVGGAETTISLEVESDWTWRDVFQAIISAVNGGQDVARAQVIEMKRPVVVDGKMYLGKGVALEIQQGFSNQKQRMVLTDGSAGLLGALGLTATARPGRDGILVSDGVESHTMDNRFSLDRGRVLVHLKESFGESIPMRVVQAMGEIELRFSKVIQEYNGLIDFLVSEGDLWEPILAESLLKPVFDNEADLQWMGVFRIGENGLLFVDQDRFTTALGESPERARKVLTDASGVLSVWAQRLLSIHGVNLENYLLPMTALPGANRVLVQEAELEHRSKLLDLFS